jgi:hypothetical protein
LENSALNIPPPWLERSVLFLTPAAAREAVAGDLWETCRSPRQYAAEALRTVPLVIASQMRRNLNLPALALQLVLVHVCAGGLAAAALAPVLMLRDAYQPAARPSHRMAVRQAVLVAFGGVVLIQTALIGPPLTDAYLWVEILFFGFFLMPLLCLIRAGLVMDGDRRMPPPPASLPEGGLALAHLDFAAGTRRSNRCEAAALLVAAILLTMPRFGGSYFTLAAVDVAVAVYLLVENGAGPAGLPPQVQYQRALARRRQLRCFLCWLWLSPLLLAIHARLMESGLAAGRPLPQVLAIAAAILLCYPVTALNREQGGRIQEQIGLLERLPLPD